MNLTLDRLGLARRRHNLLPAVFASMLTPAILGSANAAAVTPKGAIAAYHADLIGVMKQATRLGFQGRVRELRPMIARAFDLRYLSRRIIGSKNWRQLSAEQRSAYVSVFSRLTTATYAGRFKGYSGEKFVTSGAEKIGSKYVLVKTDVVKSDGGRIPLNYLMQKRGGRWKVIDVYLKGAVSEVATRRAEFRTVLRRDGINGLIKAIERKAAESERSTDPHVTRN